MQRGPVVVVEDDEDDTEIIDMVLKDLEIPNKIIWFTNSKDAYAYLAISTEQPFLIICDINLPGQNGIEFKKQIDANPELKKKSIPFVFFSTSANKKTVTDVYTELTVQGYFQKVNSFVEIKNTFTTILEYWKVCKHPNSF